MIDIPEERILKEITDILMNDLPKVLLELEEQSEDSIRLPPFRYVGLEEDLPPGTSLPYAFITVEECSFSRKDRIIKQANVKLLLEIRTLNGRSISSYEYGLVHCLTVTYYSRMKNVIRKHNKISVEVNMLDF